MGLDRHSDGLHNAAVRSRRRRQAEMLDFILELDGRVAAFSEPRRLAAAVKRRWLSEARAFSTDAVRPGELLDDYVGEVLVDATIAIQLAGDFNDLVAEADQLHHVASEADGSDSLHGWLALVMETGDCRPEVVLLVPTCKPRFFRTSNFMFPVRTCAVLLAYVSPQIPRRRTGEKPCGETKWMTLGMVCTSYTKL